MTEKTGLSESFSKKDLPNLAFVLPPGVWVKVAFDDEMRAARLKSCFRNKLISEIRLKSVIMSQLMMMTSDCFEHKTRVNQLRIDPVILL